MITKLLNPKTQSYSTLKKEIFNVDFPWFYSSDSTPDIVDIPEGHIDTPYYTHIFLRRPDFGSRYSQKLSPLLDLVVQVIEEIIAANSFLSSEKIIENDYSILRASVNCVHPKPEGKSLPHCDHNFEHKNMIMYLTDSGGETYVDGKAYDPKEDDIILFSGEHYMQTPKDKRRIIIVVTLLTW